MGVCSRCHANLHDRLLLEVDADGKLIARDATGRPLWQEVLPQEALRDAPAESAFTEIIHAPREVEATAETAASAGRVGVPSPTWDSRATQVVVASHPDSGNARTIECTPDSLPGEAIDVEDGDARRAAPPAKAVESDARPDRAGATASPTWDSGATQVVVAPGPRFEKALDLDACSSFAAASLDDLPAVIPAARWRALDGRIDWSFAANRSQCCSAHGSGFIRILVEDDSIRGHAKKTRSGATMEAGRPDLRPCLPETRPRPGAGVRSRARSLAGGGNRPAVFFDSLCEFWTLL